MLTKKICFLGPTLFYISAFLITFAKVVKIKEITDKYDK